MEIIKNYPTNEVEVDGVVYRRRHRLESSYCQLRHLQTSLKDLF
ncbi:hypothetical protein [Nostoc sp. NMS4]|nr:hypothetical protein [Nostoc sp. NMS4]